MKLGIIIPTYNSPETLQKLLGQAFKHTTGDFTVYVIEDGVNKKTRNWLMSQANRHKNLEVICHPVNRGVAASWNSGVDMALFDNCTHFAIMNDDIELPRGWWGKCLKAFSGVEAVFLDQPSPFPLTGWFFILSRKCIETLGVFDEQFSPFCGEDHDYWIRFNRASLRWNRVTLKIKHQGSHTLRKLDADYYKQVRNENWLKLRKKWPNIKMQAQKWN